MTVQEFVYEYNNASNKEKSIKNIILKKYIPYEEKIASCLAIVESTSRIKSGDVFLYKKNTPFQYILFTLKLIETYTTLEISDDKFSCFNLLNKENLINLIINSIQEAEYKEYASILTMVSDDYFENNRTLESILDNRLGDLEIFLNKFNDMEK